MNTNKNETVKNAADTEVSSVENTVEPTTVAETVDNASTKKEIKEVPKVQLDFSKLKKEDIVEKTKELIGLPNRKKGARYFQELKDRLEEILNEERGDLIKIFVEGGNDVADFVAPKDEVKTEFMSQWAKFREIRANEEKQAEEEKLKNLKLKKEILNKIKAIAEGVETEESYAQIKQLQLDWKQVRAIPKEYKDELWADYRIYLDKFYDNLKINYELKDLDRKKNMEFKIALCQKMNELHNEKSIKKAFILLQKYHEDFKNTGPVEKQFSQGIWDKFKEISDSVLALKKLEIEENEQNREENYKEKVLLCEKVDVIAQGGFESPKQWNDATQKIQSIFEEWKKTGPISQKQNDTIWARFKESRNKFYDTKKEYFNRLNADRDVNLVKKVALCEKAEKIKDNTQFRETTEKMLQYQKEWKAIGPVPDKDNAKIWKRFRTACDFFFNAKNEFYNKRKEDENNNLKEKKILLTNFEKCLAIKEDSVRFAEFKLIQKKWNVIGYVPFKDKNKLEKAYEKISKEILKSLKKDAENIGDELMKEQYESLAQTDHGKTQLKRQERKIFDKIGYLKSEASTLETNKDMFKYSKNAGDLLKDMDKKIANAHKLIEKLQKEIRTIRQFTKSK